MLYNFVLEGGGGAQLLVGGVPALTLGHGLSEPGAAHAFYGTAAAVKALAALPGWEAGRVRVVSVLRDGEGHACGFEAAAVCDGVAAADEAAPCTAVVA